MQSGPLPSKAGVEQKANIGSANCSERHELDTREIKVGILTFAALYHPSQSRTETQCENPGASDTAPKLLLVCSGLEDLRFAAMRLPPSVPVPWRGPACCFPFSSESGLLPIHVRTRPASAKKQASFAATATPYPINTIVHKMLPGLRPGFPATGAPGWYWLRSIPSPRFQSPACWLRECNDARYSGIKPVITKGDMSWGSHAP